MIGCPGWVHPVPRTSGCTPARGESRRGATCDLQRLMAHLVTGGARQRRDVWSVRIPETEAGRIQGPPRSCISSISCLALPRRFTQWHVMASALEMWDYAAPGGFASAVPDPESRLSTALPWCATWPASQLFLPVAVTKLTSEPGLASSLASMQC